MQRQERQLLKVISRFLQIDSLKQLDTYLPNIEPASMTKMADTRVPTRPLKSLVDEHAGLNMSDAAVPAAAVAAAACRAITLVTPSRFTISRIEALGDQ